MRAANRHSARVALGFFAAATVAAFGACAAWRATKPEPLPLPPEDDRPYCDHIISAEDRRLFCGPKTLAVDAGLTMLGHVQLVNPLLDSEASLSQYGCAALGVGPNDIFFTGSDDAKGQMYGTYWPATCGDDLPPGSILADGRRVIGCRDNRPRPDARACWYADGGFEVLRLAVDGGGP